jgi:hypothetical protein
MAAAEHPAARVQQLDKAPGTVWQRRIELALPEGARLLRVVSEPLAEPRRNALDHLLSSRKGVRRRVRRIELRVSRRGRLENVEPEEKGRPRRCR